eukprot:2881675-Prymnesium_polylepis.2
MIEKDNQVEPLGAHLSFHVDASGCVFCAGVVAQRPRQPVEYTIPPAPVPREPLRLLHQDAADEMRTYRQIGHADTLSPWIQSGSCLLYTSDAADDM